MSNVGYATLQIIPSARGFGAALDKETRPALVASGARGGAEAGKRAGRSFVAPFKGFVGPALGLAAGLGIGRGISSGLKTASFLEQAEISFRTLLGSGGKAERMLSSLSAFAAKTPFELPGLVGNARALLGAGEAAKQVIPTMQALGDLSGAMGLNQDQLNSVMRAWTQIMNKGKVQAEELLQMSEAGVPIWPLLAKAMHKPIPELQSMMKEGKLLAKDALPALRAQMEKDYGGSMAAQSKTLAGVWSTVKDTLNIAMAQGFEPLVPLLTRILPPASRALASAILAVSHGFSMIGDVVGPVIDGFRQGNSAASPLSTTFERLKDFGMALWPTLKQIGEQIMAVVGPGFRQIGAIITTNLLPALNAFLPAVTPVANFLLKILGGAVVGALKGVVNVVAGVLKVVSGLFNIFAALLTGDWSRLWTGIKQVVSGVFQGLIGAFQVWWNVGILSIFKKAATFLLKDLWKTLWVNMRGLAEIGMAAIRDGIGRILSGVLGLFRSAVTGYVNLWKNLFTTTLSIVRNGWSVLRSAFGGALAAIRTVVSQALSAIRGFFSSAFSRIGEIVTGALSRVVGALRSLPGRVRGAVSGAGQWLVSAGRNVISGFVSGIRSMAGSVIRAISSTITDKLPGFVKKALGIHSPSRVFMDLGGHTIAGFVKGIESGAGDAQIAMTKAITPPASPDLAADASVAGALASATGTPVTVPLFLDGRKVAEAVFEIGGRDYAYGRKEF